MHNITAETLDQLSQKAKQSERLRCNLDLRNSEHDLSQRMLNALEPGTIVPIHMHSASSETVAVLRGSVQVMIYADNDELKEQYVVDSQSSIPFYFVPINTKHTVECLEEGTILFECKDGPYIP